MGSVRRYACQDCGAKVEHGSDAVPGLKWKESAKPEPGTAIENEELAAALQEKAQFSRQEVDSFKLGKLSYHTSYIEAQGKCFKPVAAPLCTVLDQRIETGDGASDWAKMWGTVRCCLCLRGRDGWGDAYFQHRGCPQCQARLPPPEPAEEEQGG